MQLTPNYNLKKPEGTDPVDIQDFNDNADAIDAALKKKAESSGGDISEMTVKTLDNITTDFPVPVAGEKPKSFLGKVKKFFEDTKSWMTGVCLIGQIVNNCVTNNAKLPLSAAQGKVLMDLYNVLNTNLATKSVKITVVENPLCEIIEIDVQTSAMWCYVFCYVKAKITGTSNLVTLATGLPLKTVKSNVRAWVPPSNNVSAHSMGFYINENSLQGRWGDSGGIYQLFLAYPCK